MIVVANQRPREGTDARISVFLLVVIVAGAFLGLSLKLAPPPAPTNQVFAFPPFRMTYEEMASGASGRLRFELEWRGRNDWTERYVRNDGSVGVVTKEAQGDTVKLYGMGPAHTYPVGDESVHVPGTWFRDIVATVPSARESRSVSGSIVTVRRETPIDVEEWNADAKTGIPLGYRVIIDGKVVRETRLVSLVLADGTVIR